MGQGWAGLSRESTRPCPLIRSLVIVVMCVTGLPSPPLSSHCRSKHESRLVSTPRCPVVSLQSCSTLQKRLVDWGCCQWVMCSFLNLTSGEGQSGCDSYSDTVTSVVTQVVDCDNCGDTTIFAVLFCIVITLCLICTTILLHLLPAQVVTANRGSNHSFQIWNES